MQQKKLIVFDMDGVIVDVSRSYRETVRQTARLFFDAAGESDRLPDPLFSLEDLAAVKQAGGLNNDWELTYRVLSLLLSRVDLPAAVPAGNGWDLHEKIGRASRVGGLTSTVSDGETGYLIPWRCPEPFAERLELLLDNDELRASFGRAGREAVERFRWSNVADAVYELYEELISIPPAIRL